MRYVTAFLRFWYEFIVGDDWRIAAGVVAVLAVGALAVSAGYAEPALTLALFAGLVACSRCRSSRSAGPRRARPGRRRARPAGPGKHRRRR